MKRVSIIGCGWLGLPLGEYLSTKGLQVKGSTTSIAKLQELEKKGIEPFLLNLNPDLTGENTNNLLDSDVLVINIPPRIKSSGTDMHIAQIGHLIEAIRQTPIEKIIYVSSTSVYPELNRDMLEEDVQSPESSASPTMVKAENLLREAFTHLTILRAGGLMGYDRIPARYFAGKKGLTSGDSPVNYIHRDDAIRIIETVIEKELWGETFNIVSPLHPLRKEVYARNCEELGFEIPEFITPASPQPFKTISVEKWIAQSGYEFIYENPLDYFYQKQT